LLYAGVILYTEIILYPDVIKILLYLRVIKIMLCVDVIKSRPLPEAANILTCSPISYYGAG